MYTKALAAALATVISGVVGYLTDGQVTTVEWINVALLGAGSLAVFTAPNVPGAVYTKSILAVITAVLTLLVSLITDGITVAEWLQLAVAALGALGVYAVPNRGGATVAG